MALNYITFLDMSEASVSYQMYHVHPKRLQNCRGLWRFPSTPSFQWNLACPMRKSARFRCQSLSERMFNRDIASVIKFPDMLDCKFSMSSADIRSAYGYEPQVHSVKSCVHRLVKTLVETLSVSPLS